jgi:dihydroorotate dehydrogenase electron transfer subunit
MNPIPNEESLAEMNCRVSGQREMAAGIFLLELESPELAEKCLPGQFIHMRTADGWDPLWRRPFSIHRISEDRRHIRILYRRVGKGTSRMASLKSGDAVNLLGPLGNPFDLAAEIETALIVAGGLGIAPVMFLADRLARPVGKTVLLWGVRHSGELFGLEEWKKSGVRILTATEDGSAGFHGRVTDLLAGFLSDERPRSPVMGFACGPAPMLENMQAIARSSGFRWQASLEERMACGAGVCQGCAVRVRNKGYQMVCSDGPVFELGEIAFHD